MNKKPSQTLLFANQYYMLDFGTSSGGIFFGTSLLKQFSFNGSLSGGRAINFVPTDGAAKTCQSYKREPRFHPAAQYDVSHG